MNYLGHLYLAGDDPEVLIGSLLGDFVRGRDLSAYSPGLQRGIILHRRIDAFTDSHPAFQASRRRLSPELRRYSGILVDIFHGHFLARDWDRHHPIPLPEFAAAAYETLAGSPAAMPALFRRTVEAMAAGDWLTSYGTLEGTEASLRRVTRRMPRAAALAVAIGELEREHAALLADFESFLPDVHRYAVEARR